MKTRTLALVSSLLAGSLAALAAATGACSSSSTTSGFGPGDVDSGNPNGPGGEGGVPPINPNDAGSLLGDGSSMNPGDNCSDAAKLIYVIDDKGNLYSFNPALTLGDAGTTASAAFKKIGKPNCQWGGPFGMAGPNSMAIDRNAVAWVGDNAGGLFKVDTSNASCQSTTFKSGQHGWGKFGMGFATDQAGGMTDTLYVNDNESMPNAGDSKGLGKIDLASMTLTPIGAFDMAQAGHDCELTGTGNAQLFGFFFQQTSTVNEIDKGTAKILSNAPVPVMVNLGGGGNIDWAFSFWGGDFYLYTADTSAAPYSDVTRYRPTDKTSKVVLPQIGFNIVGAGVSTCAPTKPPIVK